MSCECYHCDQPEVMAVSAATNRWRKSELRYHLSIGYPGVTAERIARNYRIALDSIEKVCGIRFVALARNGQADISAFSSPIDGPLQKLALSEIPPTGNYDGRLRQWFDDAEQLDDVMMVAMFAHEVCHCLGLGHGPLGSLMAPVLDPAIREPQAWDIAELRARYGPALTGLNPVPPAPAPSPTTSDLVAQRIEIAVPGAGTVAFDFTLSGATFTPEPLTAPVSIPLTRGLASMPYFALLALARKYSGPAGLVGLALYLIASKASPKEALAQLTIAAGKLGIEIPKLVAELGQLLDILEIRNLVPNADPAV